MKKKGDRTRSPKDRSRPGQERGCSLEEPRRPYGGFGRGGPRTGDVRRVDSVAQLLEAQGSKDENGNPMKRAPSRKPRKQRDPE